MRSTRSTKKLKEERGDGRAFRLVEEAIQASSLTELIVGRCTVDTRELCTQWGLFTKWRRSGSAGHFCTRVHAECMAGCVRPRKTHLRRATFCSFCLNTLRVILTDDLCVRRTWKIKPEKEVEQDFSIFFGSITVSSVHGPWDSEQRTCTTLQSALYSDTDCGCRRQATHSLGFCFSTEKSSTPTVLAVLVLCLRSLAFVTVSARQPRVCQISICC